MSLTKISLTEISLTKISLTCFDTTPDIARSCRCCCGRVFLSAAACAHCAELAQCHDHLLQAEEPGHMRTLLQAPAGAQPRTEGEDHEMVNNIRTMYSDSTVNA
jgi:hypothetical protein